MTRVSCSIAALVLLSALATPASAQSGSEASMTAAARDLYQQGLDAARSGELEEAIGLFERSYALAPRDATLLNLAQVDEQAGHLVAAVDAYRRFLARAEPEVLARFADRATAALASLEPRLAHLSLTSFGVEETDEVRLDGAVLDHASFGLDLPVDPGTHVVTVHRGDDACAHESVTLVEGGRRDLEVRAACPEPEPELELQPVVEPAHDDPTPWIVVGVSGGVALIAGVVIGIVVASQPGPQPMPFVGNVGVGSFVIP